MCNCTYEQGRRPFCGRGAIDSSRQFPVFSVGGSKWLGSTGVVAIRCLRLALLYGRNTTTLRLSLSMSQWFEREILPKVIREMRIDCDMAPSAHWYHWNRKSLALNRCSHSMPEKFHMTHKHAPHAHRGTGKIYCRIENVVMIFRKLSIY